MTEKLIDTYTSGVGKAEIAVLMPIHNEAETIEKSVTELYNVISPRMPVELVLSEDGSTDDTETVIENLSEKIPLKAILSTSRKGYARGIKDGLKLVKAKYVLITDSDGQQDPRDFWKLWNLRMKYDIVSGWRKKRADALHRKIMSKIFQLRIKSAFNLPNLMDITAPFKLMKTEVAIEIAEKCKYMRESFWNEFAVRAHIGGFSVGEIPVLHRSRADKTATRVYKPWKIPKIALAQLMALSKLKSETQIGVEKFTHTVKLKRIKTIIQLIVGVAILLWLFQLANLSDVFTSILHFNLINLIGAVTFFVTASTFVALALCTTLRPSNPDAPLRKMLMASFAGQLLSDVTPVRSGYFLTPVFLKQLARIPIKQGMTGVLATGGVNSLVKVVICLVGLGYFTSFLPLPAEITNALLIGVVVLLIAGAFLLLLMWEKHLSKSFAKFERVPLIGKRLSKFTDMFSDIQEEGRKIKYSLIFVAALISLSILANATALYFIFNGIWYPSLNLLDFFFIAAFASVLTYIPITIAGLGVQEAGYVLLLHILLGLPLSSINPRLVAFALITRALFTGTDIIGITPLIKVGSKPEIQ